MLPDLFKKARYITVPMAQRVKNEAELDVPENMLHTCPKCSKPQLLDEFELSGKVCAHCGHHTRLRAVERLKLTLDENTFSELDGELKTLNPLDFEGYPEKIDTLRQTSGLSEAVLCGRGKIEDIRTLVGVMDSTFMMGSMGSVVGEKLARLFERGTEEGLPVVVFTTSGGARMHEGILSLMQMAKVSGAVGRHAQAGGLYITVLTDPTTGGVTASFAMLGDVILAEPGALIGFAGRRVIEGTISQKLPAGFQSAEFQMEHGFVDAIVPRADMRSTLAHLMRLHGFGGETNG